VTLTKLKLVVGLLIGLEIVYQFVAFNLEAKYVSSAANGVQIRFVDIVAHVLC
jgi:hypothetical protein